MAAKNHRLSWHCRFNFFVWKLLEKMKNDTTSVRMLSGHHLGDAKNVDKKHLAPPNSTFLLIAIDRNCFRRTKEEGQIYKVLRQIF